MIMYRTSSYGIAIYEHEIVRETEKSVFTKASYGEQRHLKDSHWHRTKGDALKFLLRREEANHENYLRGVERSQAAIEQLMKELSLEGVDK